MDDAPGRLASSRRCLGSLARGGTPFAMMSAGQTMGGETMTTDQLASLREHLLYLLGGGGAHLDFDKAVAGLPPELRGAKPAGQPHTPWRLLEHLRIAQWDILRFCVDPKHVSPDWP